MKLIRQVVFFAGAMALTAVASAVEYRPEGWGEVYANNGTKLIEDSHATNTWDDWTWRGKQDGTVQFCDTRSRGCSFTWGKSKSTSYSHSTGWSVGGGFGLTIKEIFESTIQASYQRSKTWSQSQSENFDMRTDLSPGQWAEPVIVAVRRWRKGHFYGGHFKRVSAGMVNGNYIYDWKWQNYGSWQGNEQEWGYKMIHVVNKRSDL